MSSHIVPARSYVLVFAALMVLTATTVGAAYLDLGPLNIVIALTIALGKTLLVMLYFMHVRWSSYLTQLVAGAGFFWLLILIGLTLSDFLTRGWLPAARGW